MQSPFSKILVYDLETGGLSHKINSITEFAGVAIDIETLEIVEEFSVMIKPILDLRHLTDDAKKEAQNIFKSLADVDADTNIKTLDFNGDKLTLRNLEPLIESLDKFFKGYLFNTDMIIRTDDYKDLMKSDWKEAAKLMLDYTYHPQALKVTHITTDMLMSEGVEIEKAFNEILMFIGRHSAGNSKPILAGHNIKKFDNPFLEKLFIDHKSDLWKIVNSFEIDTLEWARIRWFELPSFSLGICANAVGLTLKESHRALPDTIANANFLVKLLKSMRGEGTQESSYVRRKFNFNF